MAVCEPRFIAVGIPADTIDESSDLKPYGLENPSLRPFLRKWRLHVIMQSRLLTPMEKPTPVIPRLLFALQIEKAALLTMVTSIATRANFWLPSILM